MPPESFPAASLDNSRKVIAAPPEQKPMIDFQLNLNRPDLHDRHHPDFAAREWPAAVAAPMGYPNYRAAEPTYPDPINLAQHQLDVLNGATIPMAASLDHVIMATRTAALPK